ncbi:MAG: hypothetical protein COA78_36180 [Blastopirellula sp.]|nr:MAG: hypothetical protein COA78_36180 [Blastopirellula sp.]
MYRYLNIRSDKHYSEFIESIKVIIFLDESDKFIQVDHHVYKSVEGYPWTYINLLEADKDGNFSLDQNKIKEKINLIEIICSDIQENEWYQELAKKIARQFSWEVQEV